MNKNLEELEKGKIYSRIYLSFMEIAIAIKSSDLSDETKEECIAVIFEKLKSFRKGQVVVSEDKSLINSEDKSPININDDIKPGNVNIPESYSKFFVPEDYADLKLNSFYKTIPVNSVNIDYSNDYNTIDELKR